MKKVLAFLLSAAMLLALAACGGNQGGADNGTGGEGGEALRVGMICESLGTQSFNDDVLLGLETAVAELGIKEDHIEVREVSDAANSLRTLISQGCTFMVVPSSSYRDAMVEVAEEPDSSVAAKYSAQGCAARQNNRQEAKTNQVTFQELTEPDPDNPFEREERRNLP